MKVGSILVLVVVGVLVMIHGYLAISGTAPLELKYADTFLKQGDLFDELAERWDTLGYPENAAKCREDASQARGYALDSRNDARITTFAGYFFSVVGITLTSLGVGSGILCLASFWRSRRNETKI